MPIASSRANDRSNVPVGHLVALLAGWERRRGPRYLALADALADAIAEEALSDGDGLPAERALAEAAGVSRGTVVAAYGVLVERELVARRRGSGTVVRSRRAPSGVRAMRSPQLHRVVGPPDELIDLTFGAPSADGLVAGIGADVAAALAGGAPHHGLDALGLPALREAIAERLTRHEGVPTDASQVLVTTGATGALQLLVTALVRPGDRVVVEAPTWPGFLELLSRAGAAAVAVRRDGSGPRLDDLARALSGPGAALVFLVPTGHNPTGAVMSERRRREVLALCAEHEVLVVDDLVFAHGTFDGPVPPHLCALRPEGDVVAVGSFSKSLWGGLRTGFLRGDPSLVLRLGRLKAAQDLGSGMLDQAAVLGALPRLDAIVDARRPLVRERHDALLAALAEHLPAWDVPRARAGLSVWARLPAPVADELAAAAARHGVAISSGTSSAPGDLFLDHVRLCFGLEPEVLREAVARLALAWEEVAPAGATARRRDPAAASP